MEDKALLPSLQRHPIYLQLQFLPLLYADPSDGIGVTHLPASFNDPRLHLLQENDFTYDQVQGWGSSRSIAAWAKQKQLPYSIPPWDIVQLVNSKAFSFQASWPLPGAALLHTWDEVKKWEATTAGTKVLKTCYGVSGKGHLFLPADPVRLKTFVHREFSAGRPLIAEPWVERKLDFSTQWILHLDKSIEYVGATVCISDSRGCYRGTHVGELSSIFGRFLPFLAQHKANVLPVLHHMRELGYFGNVGIDAMIWGSDVLHSIVEINARKTMGWVALEISKRRFRKQAIALSYRPKSRNDNLLPDGILQKNGNVLQFSHQLVVDILAK